MRLLALAALLFAAPAAATTYTGADWGGADLTLANNDVLSGTFTNVGKLTLPAGATVFIAPNVSLTVYASTIAIYGTLDGSGRGFPGGSGGGVAGAGSSGFEPVSGGAGQAGAAAKGGGGAGFGGTGGAGGGVGAGAGGSLYGAAITAPVSSDDAYQGSGGGGGGGGSVTSGGAGGAGGASVFLEASSVTITGSINVSGAPAPVVSSGGGAGVTHPGGGGGGGGGAIVLRVTKALRLTDGARLASDGGKGGDIATLIAGTLETGGGGSGGRIRVYAAFADYGLITVSTSAGQPGTKPGGFGGTVDATNFSVPGSSGVVSFSTVAVSPTNFSAQAVYVTSISYVWTASASFGDGANPQYRVFPATAAAPRSAPEATSAVAASTVTNLSPNTTYYRFVTAYTDWGDSAPSNAVTTHTLANVPVGTGFSGMADTSVTFGWGAGTPANPSYTVYEVNRALDSGFGTSVSTGYVVATSSAPANLAPNTRYWFRARAVNIDGVPSGYTSTFSTATLATAPSSPALGTVFVTSVSFVWSGGANPAGTQYTAQVSSDNFFSIAAASTTLATSATFFSLVPGTQYYFRAFATNLDNVQTAYSAVISTKSGNLNDTSQPVAPGMPAADRQFSYDGAVVYQWSAASSGVGILDYHLIVGSTPGGNDVLDTTTTTLRYPLAGLATGRSYYARVRARSNAGIYSDFSAVSPGLPVFIATQSTELPKPIAWPNPADPSQGPTQLGFFLEEPATVVVKVYTAQGRKIHEHSRTFGTAGNQIDEWNASGVAPGGYIVLIEKHYGSRTSSQKLKVAVLY